MKTRKLTEVLERVEAWPADVQNELAEFALELDAGFKGGEYEPTPEELAGIDRGLRAAAEGRFARDQEVEAVLAKFRASTRNQKWNGHRKMLTDSGSSQILKAPDSQTSDVRY